jgi:hypothetical protein
VTEPGDDSIACLLQRQQHVVTRPQALAAGLSREALRHRIRPGGPWQRLLPGVYLTVTGTPTRAQAEIAAVLYAGPASVITGLAALRRHRVRVPETRTVAVLIPAGRVRRSRSLVSIRPTVRMPAHLCSDGPVQFALPPRAVADAARELGNFREFRALVADAVQQRRCRIDRLADELEQGPVRHSAWLRQALAEVADGIRSGAEGDFRDLLRRAGLPMPMFNARLYAGQTFIAVADAWWPEAGVVVEVESRAWHLAPEDWESTLRRSARLSALGIIVVHITPGQIRTEPARVAADIGAALRAGRGGPGLAVRARAAH